MKCTKCGKEFEGQFCPECGTQAEETLSTCPVCGKERVEGSKFCPNCGYNFDTPDQSVGVTPTNKGRAGGGKVFPIIAKVYRWLIAGGMLFVGIVSLLCLTAPTIVEDFLGLTNKLCTGFMAIGGKDIDVPNSVVNASIMLLVVSLLCLVYGGVQLFFAFKKPYNTVKKLPYWIADGVISLILMILGFVVVGASKSDELAGGKIGSGFAMCIVMGVFGLIFLAARIVYELKFFKWEDTGLSEEQVAKLNKERKKLTKKQIKAIAISVISVAVILAVVIPTVIWSTNIFRIGKVDKINIGDSQEQVVKVLGEPYKKTNTKYEYYSDEYVKIADQIEKLNKTSITTLAKDEFDDFDDLDDIDLDKELGDLLGGLDKATELNKKLNEMTYKYIEVTFDSDKKVTSIFFDNNKNDSRKEKDNKKEVKSYELNVKELQRYTKTDINYSVKYIDGSLYKGVAVEGVTNLFTVDYPVNWTDRYGNKFDVTLKTKDNTKPLGLVIEGDIVVPDGVTSIDDIFAGSKITSIVIPSSVTSISAGAFSGCSKLESITLPFVGGNADAIEASSTTLFGYIFGTSSYTGGMATKQYYENNSSSCATYYIPTSLRNVTITGGKNIYFGAFSNCSSLTSIEIPSSVTSIGSGAFAGCDNLQYNEYNNAKYLGNSDNLYLVLIKAKNKDITTCAINAKTRFIHSDAFSGCSSLINIIIPCNVTSIDIGAFYGCNGLESITIDSANTVYKSDGNCIIERSSNTLIAGCKTSVIPNYVTSIDSYSFSGCISLTSIEIPSSVTSIGWGAFLDCSSLTRIEIPSSVTSIDEYAFLNCDSLTIYCEISSEPSGWDSRWNYSNRPVVWNYTG